jgi:hypothetical protein
MSDNERRSLLVRLLTSIDQQATDAKALVLELPPDGDEYEAVIAWITELRQSAERAKRLIAMLDEKTDERRAK